MLTKRIIPCLDIKNGRTVKGIGFTGLKDAGCPVELAEYYALAGADELVFLDITATIDRRKTFAGLVTQIAAKMNIPFTVGGGITCEEDVRLLLEAGADKVSVNSAAIDNPDLIDELSRSFGRQCVVAAVDAQWTGQEWEVFSHGGRINTGISLFEWVKELVERGAGEILFTSISHDGAKSGFALEALQKIDELVKVPLIASGGAGSLQHFADAFLIGKADAALAASVFHYNEIDIRELKKYLRQQQIPVRL